jgi:hypothetical protein
MPKFIPLKFESKNTEKALQTIFKIQKAKHWRFLFA